MPLFLSCNTLGRFGAQGRKPTIDAGAVRKLKSDGLGASEIAKRLKIGRASVYRVLA
jgi:DNA invertase Pin-like site-specific DNA recombinase